MNYKPRKQEEKEREYDYMLEVLVTAFIACVILFIFVKIVFL